MLISLEKFVTFWLYLNLNFIMSEILYMFISAAVMCTTGNNYCVGQEAHPLGNNVHQML